MKIRDIEKNDFIKFIDLCKQHAVFEKTNFDEKNIQKKLLEFIFQSNCPLQCVVFEDGKKLNIFGYATFIKQFSTWDADYYLYVDCLFIEEDYRGKGYGTKIMEYIKNYANHNNCKIIQWQTPSFNKNAIEFYKKIGAKSKNKRRFFLELVILIISAFCFSSFLEYKSEYSSLFLKKEF